MFKKTLMLVMAALFAGAFLVVGLAIAEDAAAVIAKARWSPLGDHVGCLADVSVEMNGIVSPPSAEIL